MQMGATQTFSSWSSPRYDSIKEKEIQRNILKYFWSFWFFESKQTKKGKAKTRKNIYMGKLPTSKRRTRKYFWVFFLVLQQFKLGRKIKKKQETYFGFPQSFSNTQEESQKNNLSMDDTVKKCGHRQLE